MAGNIGPLVYFDVFDRAPTVRGTALTASSSGHTYTNRIAGQQHEFFVEDPGRLTMGFDLNYGGSTTTTSESYDLRSINTVWGSWYALVSGKYGSASSLGFDMNMQLSLTSNQGVFGRFSFYRDTNPTGDLYTDSSINQSNGRKQPTFPFFVTPTMDDILVWCKLSIPNTADSVTIKCWPWSMSEPSDTSSYAATVKNTTSTPHNVKSQSGYINFSGVIYNPSRTVDAELYIHALYFYKNAANNIEAPLPVQDDFNRGSSTAYYMGWGSSNGAPWEGAVSRPTDAINHFTSALLGATNWQKNTNINSQVVADATDSYGVIVGNTDAAVYKPYAQIGKPIKLDQSVLTTFSIQSGTSAQVYIGLRATQTTSGSYYAPDAGYFVAVTLGSTTVKLYKKTSGGSLVQVGSNGTLGAAIAAGTKYSVRLEYVGTTLRCRVWIANTSEPGTYLISTTDSALQNNVGQASIYIIPSSASAVPTVNFYSFYYAQLLGPTASTVASSGALVASSVTNNSAVITLSYTNDTDNDNAIDIKEYKLSSDDTYTSSAATVTKNSVSTPKTLSFTLTGLAEAASYDVHVHLNDPDGTNGPEDVYVTFVTATYTTSLSTAAVTAVTPTSISVSSTYTGDENTNNAATVAYRVFGSGGSYSAEQALTVTRGTKTWAGTITGLTHDVIYDIRITYTDTDGIVGSSTQLLTAQTLDRAVALSSLATIPQTTSAVINVFYQYDSNNNSTLSVQYRPISASLWTTLPSSSIIPNRASKYFFVTLPNLAPSSSYQVQVTVTDTDGVAVGTSPTLSGVVTTLGIQRSDAKKLKHYIWKVYDSLDNYLGTWHDVSDPEFSMHENGGVSDLSLTLHRPISQLQDTHKMIDFENRIDIWAYDPSSSTGFGRNLMLDEDVEFGAYSLGTNWSISATGGPDKTSALQFSGTVGSSTFSDRFAVSQEIPYVATAIVRCQGFVDLTMRIVEYDANNNSLGTYSKTTKTVGQDWQLLTLDYTPDQDVFFASVEFLSNPTGIGGKVFVDKITLKTKYMLVYRGYIESFTASIDQNGEQIAIQALGLTSQLSDDYIEFLQYVTTQPAKDLGDAPNGIPPKENRGPQDPGQMLRDIIDIAQNQNPRFKLYYTGDSIVNTGTDVEYTFRDQTLQQCFDKIRDLCPPDWHYFVEPDGLVRLRNPDNVPVHKLRIGVEVMNVSVEQNIRDLKNVIFVHGRQDEDKSEPDGFGSINFTAFDQDSINKYGRRVMFIRDANITDPATAELIGNGRLEEMNRSVQRATTYIPDIKLVLFSRAGLRGYDIEQFIPGDQVILYDPIAGPRNVYWDQFDWDDEDWDITSTFAALPEAVPIVTVQYFGDHVVLELNERQPSAVSEYAKMYHMLQLQDAENST